MSVLFSDLFPFFRFLQKPKSIHDVSQMATQPNVQFFSGHKCFRNLAGEELCVDYILEIGRVVRYDVDYPFDDFPATKNSERGT